MSGEDESTGRTAFITLATGSEKHGPIHALTWQVPADDDAMERFSATLTDAYGPPHEWVSDETGQPGRPAIVFYEAAP